MHSFRVLINPFLCAHLQVWYQWSTRAVRKLRHPLRMISSRTFLHAGVLTSCVEKEPISTMAPGRIARGAQTRAYMETLTKRLEKYQVMLWSHIYVACSFRVAWHFQVFIKSYSNLFYRDCLWKFFLPADYQDMKVTEMAQPGQPRQIQAFELRMNIIADATIDLLFTKNRVCVTLLSSFLTKLSLRECSE